MILLTSKHRKLIEWISHNTDEDDPEVSELIKWYCIKLLRNGCYNDADRNDLNDMRNHYITKYKKRHEDIIV